MSSWETEYAKWQDEHARRMELVQRVGSLEGTLEIAQTVLRWRSDQDLYGDVREALADHIETVLLRSPQYVASKARSFGDD
jgi:chromosome condensin MukBEF MukE localization factor